MQDDISVLLFDLGGVIIDIDFQRVFMDWSEKSLIPAATLRSRFTMDEAYRQHECGSILANDYFEHLRKTLGLTLSDDAIKAGWNNIFVGMMPGKQQLLEALQKKIPIYCFTNTNVTHRNEWQRLFTPSMQSFREIFISCDIGMRKPDQKAFDHVVDEIGVPHHKILFFDDSPENIAGAEKAGLKTVHVNSSDMIYEHTKNWLS